jgi:hypothetical protein
MFRWTHSNKWIILDYVITDMYMCLPGSGSSSDDTFLLQFFIAKHLCTCSLEEYVLP